jgi:hypothetical protein
MSRFYIDEEREYARLKMLKELVTEHELHPEPCRLLESQLDELEMLCERLAAYVRKVRKHVQRATS